MTILKRTALYEEHVKLGGRLIDFGGWELPVQYSGVIDEHLACRASAGLFDVSHMGEIHVEGKDSEAFLNFLVTNDVSKLAVGQAQYTAMCNDRGGIVDDLVIYRRALERFLVVVNASNTDKDFAHFQAVESQFRKSPRDLAVSNHSAEYTQIAIQGRNAAAILSATTDTPLAPIKTYWFAEGKVCGHVPAILARTGYTGEDGFEIYVPWSDGPELWRALLKAGERLGIKACGLGARDTLRLEMKYPLYGNELTDETNALEAGLGWVVKFDKGDFVGRAPLQARKEAGLSRKLVGLKLLERGIARHGYPVFGAGGTSPARSESSLGEITSGTQSPSLKESVAVAYVPVALAALGSKVTVGIRDARVAAEVVATPFYKRNY